MDYKQRLTIPEEGNPYYNTKSNGGYSTAIVGKPTCEGLNVLSNCSGYSVGRFHEICGDKTFSLLCPSNAKDFMQYMNKDLKTGLEPKLGACLVWSGGSRGFGHVAICEQINGDGSIVTSESGYGYLPYFYTKVRKNDGRWGQDSSYTFLGFIYQKEEYEMDVKADVTTNTITFAVTNVHKGVTGNAVKQVQAILKGLGYYRGNVDGDAGNLTVNAIKAFQQAEKSAGKYTGNIDGDFGKLSWQAFLG